MVSEQIWELQIQIKTYTKDIVVICLESFEISLKLRNQLKK